MFQKSIVKKYLRTHLDPAKTDELYKEYTATFHNPEKIRRIRDSKEEQYQEGFLQDLFCAILGYTINPEPNYNLITEKKNDSDSRKADGAIIIEGRVQAVIELKGCDTTDLSKVENQAFGYKAHNPTAHLVIICNFEKLRLYIEDASDFLEFNIFTMSREDFGLLCLCLSLENLSAQTALRLKRESLSAEISITDKLYADYSTFKRALFDDICKNNALAETAGPAAATDKLVLFRKTQKLLDRILFILFAEDRGLLPENSILTIIEQWQKLKELDAYQPLYSRFLNYFDRINTGYKSEANPGYVIFAYNGGLFSKDEILDTIRISDDILCLHTKRLSEYDFESEVSIDILGHIFEHSLSEIEEMQEEIANSSNDKELKSPGNNPNTTSKRKKDGVFYTQAYITKYIVESTIGRLCDAKKAELGINDEAFAQKRRNKNQRAELGEKLKAYRHWLLSLKICDPACGSGAFLNATLQFLKAEHALVDELNAKLHGDTLIFQEVENAILENNLYGVDINEESVEIARLSLWLHTAQRGRKLSTLSNNIKCGNSLIDDPQVAGKKAFCWEKEFPEVFGSSGFDVVIGNPPYVPSRSIPENEKQFYYQHFKTAEYQINTYALFMERLFSFLKSNGLYGMIIPNWWLSTKFDRNLRQIVFCKNYMQSILNTYTVFEDAVVDTVIPIGKKMLPQFPTRILSIDRDCKTIPERLKLISKHEWAFEEERKFSDNDEDVQISFSKTLVLKADKKLQDYFSLYQGMKPYEQGKGKPPQTKEMMQSRIYNSEAKVDETYFPLLGAVNVQRYYIRPRREFIKYGENLAAPRKMELFEGERVLANRIISKDCLDCCFIDYTAINNTDVFNLIPKENCQIKALFAIVASRLCAFYLKSTNVNLDRSVFPKINVNTLGDFPIPDIDNPTFSGSSLLIPISTLADKMLALNADLQKSARRFLKRVQDNLNPAKVSAALENFYTMEFADFVRELAKQKVRPSLKQQDEWEDYFAEYKADCLALAQEIAATDNQINRLVYQLYGLTDEEIAVVEGS